MLSDGRDKLSRSWQIVSVADRVMIGFPMGIGRLGDMATKYENITSSPPI